jgi:hypothetical protein
MLAEQRQRGSTGWGASSEPQRFTRFFVYGRESSSMNEVLIGQRVGRRSFLRGSGVFAAALGLSAVPALAQQPQQPPAAPKPKPEPEPEQEEEKPLDPFGEAEKPKDGKLYDKEGREYRVCPQCAYNMYKQGRMWVCENCGYSYVE